MMIPACKEPLQNVAYVHDGTLEGLLSAVFLAYERHEDPQDIVSDQFYVPRLGQSVIAVDTDFARASRVRKGVVGRVGKRAFEAIARAWASDDYGAGAVVLHFVRYAMVRPATSKVPVLDELANPVVENLVRLSRQVVNESEKARQFARFSHLENGVWFARVKPSASVVPFVMGHFADRLNDQPFILYDEAHKLAGVYDGRSWHLVRGEAERVCTPTKHDARMQEAWVRFYDALTVQERYNPELRRQLMPMRLWSNLPEMGPRAGVASRSPTLYDARL